MSEIAVRAEHLSKRYSLRRHRQQLEHNTLFTALTHPVSRLFRRPASAPGSTLEDLWALRDATFEVHRGEVLGVVGPNGAGKTTLFKILSRITDPTEGKAWVNGRVGALLEVGTALHPELTGRENVFFLGAVLGMKRTEVLRKLDAVVAFAEVARFLDTPIKHYSSGMQLRLAFSVAAHLEPEIFLIDESLAVGDVPFQKRCIEKMRDIARQGRTVLFVSHDLQVVSSLCRRAIFLQGGRILFQGPTAEAVEKYLKVGMR